MGLTSLVNRVQYVGDGSSATFPFPYYFFQQSDLSVYLFDPSYSQSSAIFPQAIGTNYTVTGTLNSQGVYPSGGAVVINCAVPVNYNVIITRNPALQQTFSLIQNQAIPSATLIQQLDYLTAITQRLEDQVSRAVQLPDGLISSSFVLTLPATTILASCTANQVLALNSSSTGFQWVVAGTGGGGGSVTFPITVAQGGTGLTVAGSSGTYLQSNGTTLQWTPVAGASTGSTDLTNQVKGILPVANGGTNISTLLPSQILFGSTTAQVGQTTGGVVGQVLTFQGSSAPIWTTPAASSGSTSLTNQVSGILPVANGGTGQGANYVAGQVIFACSATQLGFVPPGTSGQFLTYQGSSAPTWTSSTASGSTSLTNQVSGILPIANGGTGNPNLSGSTFTVTTALVSILDSSASIGLASNSSGQRFNACYLTNDFWVGPNNTQATDYIRIGRTASPGPLPGIQFGSGQQGYQIFNQGPNLRIANIGAGNHIFDFADHYIQAMDTNFGKTYFTASTANTINMANVLIGLSGSGGYYGQLSLGTAQNGGGNITIANSGASTGYTMYLPAAQAASPNLVLTNDGSGNLNWATPNFLGSTALFTVSTKTANYNATNTDNLILAQSGCAQVGLFAPAGNTGRQVLVKHITSGGDRVTITCSTATIDGSSLVLVGQYESYSVVSDGTNWQVVDHQYPPISMRWMIGSLAPSAAYQTIAWRTADYDSAAIMNSVSGVMTMPRAGKWMIEANVVVAHTAVAGDVVQLAIFKNGNAMSETVSEASASGNNIICTVADNLNLAINDQITIRHINQNTNPSIRTGSSNSYVSAVYLGQ